MGADAITIARPYAEAAFARAVETDKVDLWSDMLELLAAVSRDPALAGLIASPKLDRAQMGDLMVEIGGGRLSDEGQNLVRLIAQNRRLGVLPQVADLYETLRAEHAGTIDVQVTSAFPLRPDQAKALEASLAKKLGRTVRLSSEQDPELIGGLRIRAGDLVIDGSVAGQLGKLANELGI
jgi:F-type H+-transporting ATPase subunit delta